MEVLVTTVGLVVLGIEQEEAKMKAAASLVTRGRKLPKTVTLWFTAGSTAGGTTLEITAVEQ